MGLGSTAKKLQTVAERGEQVYKQVQDLQRRIIGLEASVEETHDTVTDLEHRVSEQRALLEAIAEERGIDVEDVLADAAIEEAETDEEASGDADAEAAPSEGADASTPEADQ